MYPAKSSMGVKPSTRTCGARSSVRIGESTGKSGCFSPASINLARGSGRTSRRKARRELGNALVGLEVSEDADERRAVHAQALPVNEAVDMRDQAPCGICATRPVKPATRISRCMNSLCTMSAFADSRRRRVIARGLRNRERLRALSHAAHTPAPPRRRCIRPRADTRPNRRA